MEDDDDEVAAAVRAMNVNSRGVRRGSEHLPSATMSFGDPTCRACSTNQLHGGCEQHRKRNEGARATAAPVAPAPYAGKKAERDLYFDPKEIERPVPSAPDGFQVVGAKVKPKRGKRPQQ